MMTVLYFACFCPSLVMMEKFLALSSDVYTCGMMFERVITVVCHTVLRMIASGRYRWS